ncbi:coiled-coil domain-containing protein [Anaeromyxobacter paludicola]|uniref:Uncharacterized protein n=1 Tax=Anaeromyxobacter paludicola TaxID=2918171 RepID=A0ABM7X6E5_9BACT|nr:hypothetical protein [Anaeromyxobacter paludicola]BDG07410.1 hypothetical protein AMPC_05230 [Anaeromyxobacter paludicola]
MSLRLVAATVLLASASAAWGSPFPARGGTTGLLDVPDAETLPAGQGLVGGELRLDRHPSGPPDIGPMPFSIVGGTGHGFDLGFSLREWGSPGDPHPSPLLFNTALKLHLTDATEGFPALAIDAVAERFNWHASGATHLIASTQETNRVRFAGFAGVAGLGRPGASGISAGLAASLSLNGKTELVAEGLTNPGGSLFGASVRYNLTPITGVSLGLSWLPQESGVRFSLGFGFASPTRSRRSVRQGPAKPAAASAAKGKPQGPVFLDDRPHFRMKLRGPGAADQDPRHLQYGLVVASTTAPVAAQQAAPSRSSVRQVTLSPDEQAGRDLDRRSEQLDARERRLATAEAGLNARDKEQATRVQELARREQKLAEKQKALDARERSVRPGTPSDRERQLVVSEGQFRNAEQDMQAQQQALRAISEAASQREVTARARDATLRAELQRLSSARAQETSSARLLELRRQLVFQRNAALSNVEELLAARYERQDAVERSLRVGSERLDSFEKRLGVHADRLALAEQRLAAASSLAAATVAPGAPKPPAGAPAAGVPAPSATAPLAAGRPKLQLGEPTRLELTQSQAAAAPVPAVDLGEATVLAGTAIYFADASAAMQDLDREALLGIARLARDGVTVLVRARARDEATLPEAARRADEVRAALVANGVQARAVVVQTSVRASTAHVDVVVSALRGGPAVSARQAKAAADLLTADAAGRRRLREALASHQADLDRCAAAADARATRGAIRLVVSADGILSQASADETIGGAKLATCLREAATGWILPPSAAPYRTELPATLVTGASR